MQVCWVQELSIAEEKLDLLEGGRELSEHIFIFANHVDNCVFFTPHDAIPNYDFVFDLR